MESEEERIPVEDVIEMDDTETPTEDGETLEPEANEDESKDTDATDDETQSEDNQTDDADVAEVGGDEPLDDGEPVVEDDESIDDTAGDEGEETEEESEPTEEEKEEAEEALEQLKEIVSNAALSGGLSEGEAELVSMSLNMVGKKVSLSQERMVPSLESFSEFSSRRLLATNVVLNNIEYALSQLRG